MYPSLLMGMLNGVHENHGFLSKRKKELALLLTYKQDVTCQLFVKMLTFARVSDYRMCLRPHLCIVALF